MLFIQTQCNVLENIKNEKNVFYIFKRYALQNRMF